MAWYADTLWCDGCGVEIRWEPIEKNQLVFCCNRCFRGEECECEDLQDEYPSNQDKQQSSYSETAV